MASEIKTCDNQNCKSEYQDKKYGKGKRVHGWTQYQKLVLAETVLVALIRNRASVLCAELRSNYEAK